MKKITIVIGLLLFSFTLSGCDFLEDVDPAIKDDIKETKEEICADNPDDPVCDDKIDDIIDDVDSVEDYLALFNQFLTEYSDESTDVEAFCTKYFTTETKEACIIGNEEIDMTSYSFEILSYKVHDEENLIYDFSVIVKSNDVIQTGDHIFATFSTVDGVLSMIIEDSSTYNTPYIEADMNKLVIPFFNDLVSPDYTEETFTEKYDMPLDSYRVLRTLLLDADDFKVEPSFSLEHQIKLILSYDEFSDCDLYLTFEYNDVLDNYTIEFRNIRYRDGVIDTLVNEFVKDYNNSDIEDNDFITEYFSDDPLSVFFLEERSKGWNIMDYNIDLTNPNLLIFLSFENNEHLFELDFKIEKDNISLTIQPVNEEDDPFLDYEFEETFRSMIEKINIDVDSTVSNYFTIDSRTYATALFTDLHLAHIEVLVIVPHNNYYSAIVSLETLQGDHHTYAIDFTYEKGLNNNYQFRLLNTELQQSQVRNDLNEFLNVMEDQSFTTDQFLNTFVTDDSHESLRELRELIYLNGYTIETLYINAEEDNNYMVFKVKDGNTVIKTVFVSVDLIEVTNGSTVSTLLDIHGVREMSLPVTDSEIRDYLDEAIIDHNDPEISNIDFCLEYGALFVNCDHQRTDYLFNGRIFELKDITPVEGTILTDFELSIIVEEQTVHTFPTGIIVMKDIYGEVFAVTYYKPIFEFPVIEEPFDYPVALETSKEQAIDLLTKLVEGQTSTEDLIAAYHAIDYFDFLENRALFSKFTGVSFETSEGSEKIKVVFTDEDNAETIVYYYLSYSGVGETFKLKFDSLSVSVQPTLTLYTDVEEALNSTETPSELVYNIESPYYGITLYDFLSENNLTALLDESITRDMTIKILNSENQVVFILHSNIDRSYNVIGEFYEEVTVNYYTHSIEQDVFILIADLSDNFVNGSIDINDVDAYTDCLAILPTEYDSINISFLLESRVYTEDFNQFNVTIEYEIDDETYITSHVITVNTVDEELVFNWEHVGYYIPLSSETIADAETTSLIAAQLLNDVWDPDVTLEYIQDTYFQGMSVPDLSEGDRQQILTEDMFFTFKGLEATEMLDEEGNFIFYNVEIELISQETLDNTFIQLIVYIMEDESYFVNLEY